ncbi:hypothetical protein CR513_24957, partial [Mucuna pruriens]
MSWFQLEFKIVGKFILHQHIKIGPPSPAHLASLPTLGCRSTYVTPQVPSRDRTFHRLLRSLRSSEIVNSNSNKSSVFASNYGEDPHKHLKEYHIKTFPFSLDGAAKDLWCLQLSLFNTWGDMKRMLLEKFFPTFRTTSIRKEICDIRQHSHY